ncbi:thymic stromal lymphopoietin isoform X2 [Cricetulus griseus]|uniref:Thymic stromal lymphopoietin isoform X2 n=1 Tax=Cricetulus griseus TaxID=10029 RepID=A0A9J7GND8_CRIGR|nr:thymic stromal lymphopoietin isoform X2 [Cricetulus griseus]
MGEYGPYVDWGVLLRDLLILQVVQLVLAYNFSNCNFEEISNMYSEAIYPDLFEYLNGSLFEQNEVCDNSVSEVVGCAGFPRGGRQPGRELGKTPQAVAELQEMLAAEPIGDIWTDCLMKIEYLTLNPIPGCPSLPREIFALHTKATLISQCPGYSETQRNNAQEMKLEVKDICLNQTSQIQFLWHSLLQTLKY